MAAGLAKCARLCDADFEHRDSGGAHFRKRRAARVRGQLLQEQQVDNVTSAIND